MTGKENDHLPYDLENMSIPELETLLQQDFIASDGAAPDADYIMAIVEVIQKKEQKKPDYQPMDAEKAWNEFQSFCNSKEGTNSTCRSEDSKVKAEFPRPAEYDSQQKKSGALRRRFAVVVLAAALLAVTLVPVAGYANVLQMVIAYWTDDYFSFAPGGSNSAKNSQDEPLVVPAGFEELWTFAQEREIQDLAIPWYIPDGFQVADSALNKFDLTDGFEYIVFYTRDDDYISINIVKDGEESRTVYEKDNRNLSVYKLNETEYYMFSNNGEVVSSLFLNDIEYTFGTTLSERELKQIIDSMS